MNDVLKTLVAERVDVAMTHRFRCQLADPKTGGPLSDDERRETLTVLFSEIAKGMGVERFADRLFVMSPKPVKDLPAEINGVLIEQMVNDLQAVAQ